MQRNGIVVLVSAALVAVAGLVAAYLFTHKPEPEPVSPVQHGKTSEIACLEGGGTWVPYGLGPAGTCQHSEPTTAAPAPTTAPAPAAVQPVSPSSPRQGAGALANYFAEGGLTGSDACQGIAAMGGKGFVRFYMTKVNGSPDAPYFQNRAEFAGALAYFYKHVCMV